MNPFHGDSSIPAKDRSSSCASTCARTPQENAEVSMKMVTALVGWAGQPQHAPACVGARYLDTSLMFCGVNAQKLSRHQPSFSVE